MEKNFIVKIVKKNYSYKEYLNNRYICNFKGIIRPNIIVNGESIKARDRYLAYELVNKADSIIVLGSSLVVSTVGNLLKEFIKNTDKSLFIINNQKNPFDEYAKTYNEDLGKVLKK